MVRPFGGLSPKEKSGRETHRTRPRAFEQAVDYTETTIGRQLGSGLALRLSAFAGDLFSGKFPQSREGAKKN
jgi:hypothetical protein